MPFLAGQAREAAVGERSCEEEGSQGSASATDTSPTGLAAAVPIHGDDTHQSRDLLAIQGAQPRAVCDQASGCDHANIRYRLRQIILRLQRRIVLKQRLEVGAHILQGSVQSVDVLLQVIVEGWMGVAQAVPSTTGVKVLKTSA